MAKLIKIAYDINSKEGAVQACLRKKKEISGDVDQGGIKGIGSQSCCSFISYVNRDGRVDTIFGNSRIRVPFKVINGVDVGTACVHGELNALWNVIEDEDRVPTILSMYIEMSPCVKCAKALENILSPNQEILYSFDHPVEVKAWSAAAKKLCAG